MSTLVANLGFPRVHIPRKTLGKLTILILAALLVANLTTRTKLEKKETGFEIGFATKAVGFVASCQNYPDNSGFVIKLTLFWGGLESSQQSDYQPEKKPSKPPICSNEIESVLALLTGAVRRAFRQLDVPTSLGDNLEVLIIQSVRAVLKVWY
ncbi:MAG: hypothetical protein AAB443_02450 [Patescibacteria group bacterium]